VTIRHPTTQSPRRGGPGLWLPVALLMAAIYVGAGLPSVPGPAATVSDTVLHGGAYFVLSILTLRATAGGRRDGVTGRALILAFVIAVAHGASVEIEQMFTPTRLAEWRDLWNDMVGGAAGLLLAWLWVQLPWGKMKG
jgi:VanZ family protein